MKGSGKCESRSSINITSMQSNKPEFKDYELEALLEADSSYQHLRYNHLAEEMKASNIKEGRKQANLLLDKLVDQGLAKRYKTVKLSETSEETKEIKILDIEYSLTPAGKKLIKKFKKDKHKNIFKNYQNLELKNKYIFTWLCENQLRINKDNTLEYFPNQDSLAKATDIPKKEISKSIKELIDAGLIIKLKGEYGYLTYNIVQYVYNPKLETILNKVYMKSKSTETDFSVVLDKQINILVKK